MPILISVTGILRSQSKENVVVLSGFVFSAWELQDALRIARKAAGDRPVTDNLSLERDFRR
jgi:osmotically-inducible protein OsmY